MNQHKTLYEEIDEWLDEVFKDRIKCILFLLLFAFFSSSAIYILVLICKNQP